MQRSNEMKFFRDLSYEFGKDVQRLETENAVLKEEIAFHKGEAEFYRNQFFQLIQQPKNDIPKEMQKRPVGRPVVKKKYYKPILTQEDTSCQNY